MKALLYKQLKLTAHPMTFVFILCGAMLLIPNYPYSVIFFYVTLGIFFMFSNSREQRDQDYSALLPIKKRDSVKAAVIFSVLLQLASIAVAVPFMLINQNIAPEGGNQAGIDANVAALAWGFLVFTVFNAIFMPAFYRNGYKVGKAFLLANIGAFTLVALDVVAPHIIPWLDGNDPKQYILLISSAVIYAVITYLSYQKSAKLYEKVDL